MWPFLSRALFPPPTEAWLRRASSDPEAQGWGAWSRAEKTPLGPGAGDREEEETGEAEEPEEDAGFLLSLLERGDLAECPLPDQRSLGAVPPPGSAWAARWQELEAIKVKLWAMEQAQRPKAPGEQGPAGEEADARALLAGQLLSPETDSPTEAAEADHRSVYVGNVDYGGTAQELEAYFNHCGEIQRVTILCDKFSGHPKGSVGASERGRVPGGRGRLCVGERGPHLPLPCPSYAYIEFATESSAQAAVELDKSVFRGRVLKVLPKRTNLPGISSTDRGGLRGHPGARGGPFPHSNFQGGARFRPRGRNRWAGPWEGGILLERRPVGGALLGLAGSGGRSPGGSSPLGLSPGRGRGRVSPWYSPY
ncbi:embryonic polyadenylate-binding protein 2 isoform X3 [Physeter macrocephalus]|uniref:Embryonic polyadenylate-binding protein 2 isoform X3 n=1 Tax=Physeter macrocephalus TaxID=9755 RepID=A0A455BFN0_PHYMC|nr:embryonic polyadenylate-binding protein 2 isoform X3 [Physeter catodon]|eukprot:XP_028342756.1 embryonic polyadenylate-binding protein 2 isoform X3 [Physeter catodon]